MIKHSYLKFILFVLLAVTLNPNISYARRTKDITFENFISGSNRESEIRKNHPDFFKPGNIVKVEANVAYLMNELDISKDDILRIMTDPRANFFTLSPSLIEAKVNFLVSELEMTPEEIGELVVNLALPVEGTGAFNDIYGSVMLLNSSIGELRAKMKLLENLNIYDGYELAQELGPIVNLNITICSMIADYLYDTIEGLEGCGKQIAEAYSHVNGYAFRNYQHSAYQMLSLFGNTEVIAEGLREYGSL